MNTILIDTLQTDSSLAKDSLQNISALAFDAMKIVSVDCNGNGNSLMITLIGLGVVFVSLYLIYLIFFLLGKFIYRAKKKISEEDPAKVVKEKFKHLSGEESAAISAALFLFLQEREEFANTTLTIKKVSKIYSPWSSKIYGLRNHPRYGK